MGTPTVSQKIDAYAKAHLAELKKKQGLKNFTKYDIAEIMLKSGALTQAEMNSWRSTGEGFSANNRSGSVFGSGYAGQESYLDEMTDFSQKSTFEKNLEIMNPKKLRYETPKQRKTRQAQYKQHVQDQQASARIKNTKAYQNQEAMKKYLATLPPCTESYEELIASQKFESLDKSGKIKFLMEATGRKFYDAMEKGDKSAMRKYAIEGMSYVFAYMDDKSGITDIKDAVKKYSGLNALVDVVDKIVDDGDADNLSGAEKTWATIKGAGDAVDSFIGTQGVAVMGSLFLAGEAAAAAGMAKLFAVATQAYFGIEGATLVYEGGKEIAEATTEEQARTGGTKLTSGAIMLAGTVKSVKQGYENYKASQAHKADIANARKTLGLEGDAPLTEASIKAAKKSLALANHPDRGGSVEAMQNINDAASLLLKELKGGTLATTTASTADPKASAGENMPTVSTKTPNAPVVQSSPSTYRAKLPTPDYSKTRANFPTDAHQSLSKAGKATAYTTDGQPDGIVYQGKDGKMYVPNKWDPEHPYEVSTGADGKPASVIMVYDEAGGDFAVGDPTTIASTYKNPATGELDPLYSAKPGKSNAIDIVKDQVPSAYKIVKPGTEIQTKEGPRVVQPDEIVVYDTDGDPYVMPKKNFLKRQEPLKGDAESEALYARLKNGEPVPESQIAASGNATKPSAKTYSAETAQQTGSTVAPDFATEMSEIKGVNNEQILTKAKAKSIIEACTRLGISNHEARIKAVLSNPEEIARISRAKNKDVAAWHAIQDPLTSTKQANPELFGVKPKATATAQITGATTVPDFATELTNYKDANGKQFLTKSEAESLMKEGKNIPNYEAKLKAVLSNPEEIASISRWKSRAAGVWRAIQDPLTSTEQANPELFGVKPKATATAQKTGGATVPPKTKTQNILEADSPVKFNTSNFETWAKENNLTMSIEEHWGKSKRAIFKDSEGNVVRIINEDAYNPGQVYDDRIRYFKDGKQVAGKVKYTDTEKPAYYKVSSDGDVERMPLDKLNKELGL